MFSNPHPRSSAYTGMNHWHMYTSGLNELIHCGLVMPYGARYPGPWFNIKMSSYQYRKSHCGDKTVVRSSYLHNGISYTGKATSLYWIRGQAGHKFIGLQGTNVKFPTKHNNSIQQNTFKMLSVKWWSFCLACLSFNESLHYQYHKFCGFYSNPLYNYFHWKFLVPSFPYPILMDSFGALLGEQFPEVGIIG